MLDRRRRQNAVAQIENMSIAASSPAQNVFHPAFNFMERRIQYDRIQVPLYGAIVTDHGPCLIEMDAPINANDIASGFPHLA